MASKMQGSDKNERPYSTGVRTQRALRREARQVFDRLASCPGGHGTMGIYGATLGRLAFSLCANKDSST